MGLLEVASIMSTYGIGSISRVLPVCWRWLMASLSRRCDSVLILSWPFWYIKALNGLSPQYLAGD